MIEKSAMTKHAWENHHPINWEETSVLDKGQGELLLKEALHISCLIFHRSGIFVEQTPRVTRSQSYQSYAGREEVEEKKKWIHTLLPPR